MKTFKSQIISPLDFTQRKINMHKIVRQNPQIEVFDKIV